MWFDREIAYSEQWWQTIVERLRAADAVVLVMTPALEESEWIVREVLLARREAKPIFPLLLEGPGLPLVIDIQHVDVTGEAMPPDDFVEVVRRLRAPAVDVRRSEVRLDAVVHELERQEETLAAADRAVQSGRADARVHAVRARAFNELLRAEDALAAADAALAMSPDDVAALLEKGNALTWLEENDEALAIADALLRRDPHSFRAMVLRASALVGEDVAESLRWAERVLAVEPHNEDALAIKSSALAFQDEPAEAMRLADAAIAAAPGRPSGYFCKALALIVGGEHEEAKALLDSLCLIYPASAQLRTLQAGQLAYAGDAAGAEAVMRRAIELSPRLLESHVMLADLLDSRDRTEDALTVLADAERAMPEPPRRPHARVFAAQGLRLRRLDRAADARRALEHGHALDPDAATPLFGLALLALDAGDLEAGRRQLDLALDRDRGALQDVVETETMRFAVAGDAGALLLADALVARGRGSYDALSARALFLWKSNRAEEALEAYEAAEAVALPDALPDLLRHKSDVLAFVLKRPREGRDARLRARELDPGDPRDLVALSTIALVSGSREEAARYISEALEVDDRESTVILATEILQHEDKFDEALTLLDGAAARWPGSGKFHQLRARSLDRLEREEEALVALRRAEEASPPPDDALQAAILVHRGSLLRYLGRPRDAQQALQRARELDAADPAPVLGLTSIALDEEDADIARGHLRALVHMDLAGRSADAIGVARQAVAADEHELALALLEHLDAYGEMAMLAHWLRAACLGHLERPREALAAVHRAERALGSDEEHQRARLVESQGDLLMRLGRGAEARAALRRAMELDPGRPGPLVSLALLALDENNPSTARDEALRALAVDRDGEYMATIIRIGERLAEEHRHPEALEIAERTLASGHSDPVVLLLRFQCLASLGRPEEAATAAADIAEALPGELVFQEGAATTLLRVGRREPALRFARRAVALGSTDPDVLRIRGRKWWR